MLLTDLMNSRNMTDITASTQEQNVQMKASLQTDGRVLGVTAKGSDLKEARKNAYAATEWVTFENKYMRHDIGKAIDDVEA